MWMWLAWLAVGLGLAQSPADGGVEPELVVAVSPFAPFVVVDADEPVGFSMDLWRAVAREEGLRARFEVYDNVTDKLAAVESGAAQVAIGGISLTHDREERVDFSLSTFRTGLDILTRNERPSWFSAAALAQIATPGRIGIIVGFFALIVISGHLVWYAERGKEAFDDRYIPGVLEGMYWAIVTASTVGYGDYAPAKWVGRLVTALVIVVSLPMFAVFTAELASTLTVSTLNSQIQAADDLRGKTVGVVGGTTGEQAMRRLGAQVFPYESAERATLALVAGDVVAVVHDAPNLAALADEHVEDQLVVVGALFEPQHYGMVVQQGSELREILSRGILAVKESGEWSSIRGRWFEGDLGE